jgi:hypothetical protein
MPPRLPSDGQFGVQTHVPCTQRPSPAQVGVHLQVSMQVPLLQMLPAWQVTPAQRLAMHLPPAQSWLAAQVTPAHGLGAEHERLQAIPAPQAASQALTTTHLPVPELQYCPAAQTTPLHGCAKQPATQAPSMQVCPCGQLTLAQRSAVGTQLAWQVVPAAQVIVEPAAHGSG